MLIQYRRFKIQNFQKKTFKTSVLIAAREINEIPKEKVLQGEESTVDRLTFK